MSTDTSKSENNPALQKYDTPRSLVVNMLNEKSLRYKNDLYALPPEFRKNSIISSNNTSQPDLISITSDPRIIFYNYDVPGLKRTRSYVEMNLIQKENGQIEKTLVHKSSFEDLSQQESTNKCHRKSINNNLNFNNLDKNSPKGKDIAFRFSNHNNLTEHLTTAV